MTTADDRSTLATRAAAALHDVPSEALSSALAPFVADLDPATLRAYAIPCLADDIRAIRRAETLRAEREAEQAAADKARREREAQQDEEGAGEDLPGPSAEALAAERARKRAEREAAKARRQSRRKAADAAAQQAVVTFLGAFRDHCRIEWGADLLDMQIAVDNSGKTVALGKMTPDQHRQRIAMLTKNIRANAEDIARHTKAIEDMETAGVDSLNELMGEAA